MALCLLCCFLSVCLAEDHPTEPSEAGIKALISFPYPNDRLRGLIPVYGVADARDFKAYRLEFGEGESPAKWETILVSTKPQPRDPHGEQHIRWDPNYGARGNLGDWEVGPPSYDYSVWKRNLNGRYMLRLVVEDKQGRTAESRIPVNVGHLLTRLEGGAATSPDGRLRLTAPAQSVGYGDFVVVCLFPAQNPVVPDVYRCVGTGYELNPPNFQVIRPMELAISYRAEELDFDGDKQPDVAPDRIGLYWLSPVEQVWVRYRDQKSPSPGVVSAVFTGSPAHQAHIALLADVRPPDPPLLVVRSGVDPLAKNQDGILNSPSPWVEFFGQAEPDSVVRLLSSGKAIAETEAGLDGQFRFAKLLLEKEIADFRAMAVDRSGQESRGSGLLKCRWLPAAVARNSSLSVLGPKEYGQEDWMVVKVTAELAAEAGPSEGRINAELRAASLVARVQSAISDPEGIVIELRPVPSRVGTFVGSVRVGQTSDAAIPQIAANKHGERIQIRMEDGVALSAESTYKDCTGPGPPSISSDTHPSAVQAWFDRDRPWVVSTAEPKQGWRTIDGNWGAQTSIREPETGSPKTRQQDDGTMGPEDRRTSGQSEQAGGAATGAGQEQAGMPAFPGKPVPPVGAGQEQAGMPPTGQAALPGKPMAAAPLRCLRAKPMPHFPSHLGLLAPVEPFQVSQFPVISFDYRFHPELALDLLIKTAQHGWKGIWLAGDYPPLYDRLSDAGTLKADGQWHHAQFSLDAMLKKAYPAEKDWRIEEIRFQSWKKPRFMELELGVWDWRVTCDLARFAVLNYVPGAKAHLKWSAEDPNRVAGYSFVLDQSPWTTPPPLEKPLAETEKTFEGVEPGTWFFHVRAVDGPGNWGETAHYELRVAGSRAGSIRFQAPGTKSLRWPEPLVLKTDAGADLIPESLRVRAAGRRFTTADKALEFEPSSGTLLFHPDLVQPYPLVFPDDHTVPIGVEAAAGFDGSRLAEPVSFEVSWQSSLKVESALDGAETPLPAPSTSLPNAVLPLKWFKSPPRIRLADAPQGSSYRWLPEPEVDADSPRVRSLELRVPASWFSPAAQPKDGGKDFLSCVWSFGLAPAGIRAGSSVWIPGGLAGSYFKAAEKPGTEGGQKGGERLLLKRLDPFVHYSAAEVSALPPVPEATRARWEGMLYVPFSDEWSFEFLLKTTQVVARMALKGETVLTTEHQWHPHVVSGRRFLARGFYPVRIEVESPTPEWHLEWSWEAEDWRSLRRVPPENLYAEVPLSPLRQ